MTKMRILQKTNFKTSFRGGFTLIELLVVVLIIGILASVAVPQYQKAVDKSRFTELLNIVNDLKRSEDLYYLANGVYAKTYDELSPDMPPGFTLGAEGYTMNYPQKKMFFNIMDGGRNAYVYGKHNALKVSYVYMFNGTRICYTYDKNDARSNGLCASVGKFTGTDSSSGTCAAGCNRYEM